MSPECRRGVSSFQQMLAHELNAVRERRARLWEANGDENARAANGGTPTVLSADNCCPSHTRRDPTDLEMVRHEALDEGLVGLAFSGGGIRSGSVCLGFLQGLARLRLLRLFDYLSTVSGGGYAGAWFAAWVCRECHRTQLPSSPAGSANEKCGLRNVELQLDPSRVSEAEATRYHRAGKPKRCLYPAG